MKNKRILLGLILLLLSTSLSAQRLTAVYELVVPSRQSLLSAIERLALIYDIDMAYVPEDLAQQQLPAGTYAANSLDALMQQLLSQSTVQYRILEDNRILLRDVADYRQKQQPALEQLQGRVVDAQTGLPMSNVALALDTLNVGALTDEHGSFYLSLPTKRNGRTLSVYHIGYRSLQLDLTHWTAAQTVRLQAEPFMLKEVVIVEQLPSGLDRLGGFELSFTDNALPDVAGPGPLVQDVFRRVQMMAGVAAEDDLSADISIRGSEGDETLLLLDGMPLYKVDHFYGIFSAVHPAYLATVDLYKNALPVSYGGRTGGMLHMQSDGNIPNQWSGQADVDLLTASLLLRLPLSDKWSLQLSGRESHTNLADAKFFDWLSGGRSNAVEENAAITRPERLVTQPDFSFRDVNAKLLFRPHDDHRFALNFYRSNDDYRNSYTHTFRSGPRLQRVMHTEQFEDIQSWDNTGSSILYRGKLSKRWTAETDLYYTRYSLAGEVSASLTSIRPQQEIVRSLLDNGQGNQIEELGARLQFTHTHSNDHRWQVGGGITRHANDYLIQTESDTLLSGGGSAFDAQVFTAYRWEPLPGWEWSLGGRLSYYEQTNKWYAAPRLHMRYDIGKTWALKAAFGVQYQFVREIVHENRLGQSLDVIVLSDGGRIPVGVSNNWMFGTRYQQGAWTLDIEAFYRQLDAVIDHASVQLGFGNETIRSARRAQYRIFTGQGTVYGIDATLGWSQHLYESRLAYTWSKASNSFPDILRGLSFPARNDRRHRLKWLNTLKLGRWALSANALYSSGRPYYDLALLPRESGDRQQLRLDRLVSWLPSYQRLDVGIAYRFPIGAATAELSCSVLNLTNHDNVKYLQYIYSVRVEENNRILNNVIGTETTLLDRTLSVGFSLRY